MSGKTNEYTAQEKLDVLELVEKLGNVSKAAEQSGVSRGSIYKWQGQEQQLRNSVASDKSVVKLKDELRVRKSIKDRLQSLEDLDEVVGDLETRRVELADKTEAVLIYLVDLIENHPELDEIHPKDLSKIMTDMNALKKDLRREPDFIIEHRNNMMGIVIQTLKGFLPDQQIREFVDRVEQVEEAQYEVL